MTIPHLRDSQFKLAKTGLKGLILVTIGVAITLLCGLMMPGTKMFRPLKL